MASLFDQIGVLLEKKAKISNALTNDEALLKRIPNTIERRKKELAELDAQIQEFKAKVDATPNAPVSSQEGKPAKK